MAAGRRVRGFDTKRAQQNLMKKLRSTGQTPKQLLDRAKKGGTNLRVKSSLKSKSRGTVAKNLIGKGRASGKRASQLIGK